jgi:hypothetical protein
MIPALLLKNLPHPIYTLPKNGTVTQAAVNYARARNIDLITLNWAAIEDEYHHSLVLFHA